MNFVEYRNNLHTKKTNHNETITTILQFKKGDRHIVLLKIVSESRVIGQGSKYQVLVSSDKGLAGLNYPLNRDGFKDSVKAYDKYKQSHIL
jgi:hypothetical protein